MKPETDNGSSTDPMHADSRVRFTRIDVLEGLEHQLPDVGWMVKPPLTQIVGGQIARLGIELLT